MMENNVLLVFPKLAPKPNLLVQIDPITATISLKQNKTNKPHNSSLAGVEKYEHKRVLKTEALKLDAQV